MTEENAGANTGGPTGRRGPRGPENFRTVLVYPTRDGDHIMVTLNLGKFDINFSRNFYYRIVSLR